MMSLLRIYIMATWLHCQCLALIVLHQLLISQLVQLAHIFGATVHLESWRAFHTGLYQGGREGRRGREEGREERRGREERNWREGGKGASATKTHWIFVHKCQQTTNQRLAEKHMLFCVTVFVWDEYKWDWISQSKFHLRHGSFLQAPPSPPPFAPLHICVL